MQSKNAKTKIILISIIGIVLFTVSISYADVSKSAARDIVVNQIVGDEIENVNIYQEADVYSSSFYELNPYKSLSVPYSNCWVFFIDDHPMANWEHNCRYVFMNSENGSYQIDNETVPPIDYKTELEEVSINIVFEPYDYECDNPATIETREPDPHKYAVFISGETEYRHWNDMSAMYCALKQVYGFMDENMIVLSHNGEQNDNHNRFLDLDGPEITDVHIDGACTYENVENAFAWMADNLGPSDMLFVFVNDHGGTHDYVNDSYICLYEWEPLEDEDMATMVAPINCSQIVYVMEQCYSGGFQGELEGEHVTFHSATDGAHSSYGWNYGYPSAGFDEFVYFWTTATRGFHPLSDEEPWLCGDPLGSHPEYPYDFNPDDLAQGGNGNGFIQMEEAFEYADYMDLFSPYGQCVYELEFPQNSTNIGFQEDLLSLFGICGNVENSQTITGNFLVNPALTIGPEVTLTIDDYSQFCVIDDASVTLFGRSLVEVNNNSWFRFYEGSSLYGTEHTIWEDTNTGKSYDTWGEMHEDLQNNHNGNIIEIPGDRIIVNDAVFNMSGTSDNPVTITSVGDGWWDGIEINNSYSYPGNHGIIGGDVSKIGHIKLNNSNFGLSNTTYSHCGQISAVNNSYLSIDEECLIDSISACPIYCCESKVGIFNSTIRDNMGTGVYIYLPSDTLSCVSGNLITINRWGIHVIDAPMYCINNTIIHNTSHGFVSYGAGGIPILAGNTIADNDGLEVAGLYQWPDITSRIQTWGPNTIYSHDNGGVDHYLLAGPLEGNDCRGNNIDISDTTRFLPFYSSYIFDGEKPPEKIVYEEGIDKIVNEEYESAKLDMKEILNSFPETETAVSALQWLLYLEKFSGHDYAELRDYIETIDEISYPHLERVKYNTTTSTYMAEADYITAIDRLEDILTDPQSVADSILAYIDQGYCYLKLDEQGGKAGSVECKFKPRSFDEFKYVSQNLTKNLLDKAIPTSEPPTTDPQTIGFVLNQNYPNPASLSTTFSFSIPANIKNAELKIYNIKGQLVKTFIPKSNEKGTTGNLKWDCKDENGMTLCNGIYFYKLTDDKKEVVKKLVLMR